MASQSLLGKFKGSLLGGLVGDCMGAPYENDTATQPDAIQLSIYFQKVLDPKPPQNEPPHGYTDDTEMAKATAESLIANKGYNPEDLAKRFVTAYFTKGPQRHYRSSMPMIFKKLKESDYEDPYRPAREQFGGEGSSGNGAAMRVAPVVLFACHKKPDDLKYLIRLVKQSSEITHANKWGYRGAILLALAIRRALKFKTGEMDTSEFADELIEHMREIEREDNPENPSDSENSYVHRLLVMKDFLEGREEPTVDNIQKKLKVGVKAPDSVVTAIYCALASQKPLHAIEVGYPCASQKLERTILSWFFFQTDCKFHRCIQYAVSVGGDTDTIACMAGYIIGAQLGWKAIPSQFLIHSEASERIGRIAEELYQASAP